MWIAVALAVGLITYAGIKMIVNSAVPGKSLAARGLIIQILIALAIVFGSSLIVNETLKALAGKNADSEGVFRNFKCTSTSPNLGGTPQQKVVRGKIVLEMTGIPASGRTSGEQTIGSGVPVTNGTYHPYGGDSGCDVYGTVNSSIRSISGGRVSYVACSQCKNGVPISGSHSPDWDCKDKNNKPITGPGACAVQVIMPNGDYASYLHMSSYNTALKAGQVIKKGDILGYIGIANTVPHVHIEFGSVKGSEAACGLVKQILEKK